MRTALIGHTGFVGGNLLAQAAWDDCYNSRNIDTLAGKAYDLVVCAGAPAVKWWANQNPQADRDQLQPLRDALGAATIGELVLISTIDVYPDPRDVDEDSPIRLTGHHAYGTHRKQLEDFASALQPTTVVRLPGLIGPGLKKNVVFDLLHDNQVERIDPDASFQYYHLQHLWSDIGIARKAGIRLLNLATPPLRTGDIAQRCFGRTLPPIDGPHGRYDMHTRHAQHWGQDGNYVRDLATVWQDMADFVGSQQGTT